MSRLVVDASVAAKWFLDEEYAEEALLILRRDDELHVPDFFFLEMDSTLCKWIRRGIITEAHSDLARNTLHEIPLRSHASSDLRESSYRLANQTHRSFYDCLYLALAINLNTNMVTSDRRMYNDLAEGPWRKHVMLLGDIA